MRKLALLIVPLVVASFIFSGCSNTNTLKGAGVGSAIGGITGFLLDSKNPVRGAFIGAALGAALGGAMSELNKKAIEDAARQNQAVAYTEGNRTYYAVPAAPPYYIYSRPNSYNTNNGYMNNRYSTNNTYILKTCKRIHNKVIEDGQLIADNIQEVCN